MRHLIFALLLLMPVSAAAQGAAVSQQRAEPDVNVINGTIRATLPRAKQAVAVATLTSQRDDTLVSATTDVADMAHIHLTRRGADGQMVRIDGVRLEAGKPRRLSSHGYHIMLMGLNRPLRAGETVTMLLRFHRAPAQLVRFAVVPR